jgi:hypothetical protein
MTDGQLMIDTLASNKPMVKYIIHARWDLPCMQRCIDKGAWAHCPMHLCTQLGRSSDSSHGMRELREEHLWCALANRWKSLTIGLGSVFLQEWVEGARNVCTLQTGHQLTFGRLIFIGLHHIITCIKQIWDGFPVLCMKYKWSQTVCQILEENSTSTSVTHTC